MIFNRRDALKALALIPVAEGAKAVPIGDPARKQYIMFFDARTINIENFAYETPASDALIWFIPVKLCAHQTLEEAVQMYEVPNGLRP